MRGQNEVFLREREREREKRTGLRTSEGRRGLLLIPAHEVNKRKGERNRNERNG